MPLIVHLGARWIPVVDESLWRKPESEERCSPSECTGIEVKIQGNLDARHIPTSHVERQNLTMRIRMRPVRAPKKALKEG